MDRSEIEAKIKSEIANLMDIDEDKINIQDNLIDGLGFDEFDAVELILGLEVEFDISISDEEEEKLHIVQDYVDLISNKLEVADGH